MTFQDGDLTFAARKTMGEKSRGASRGEWFMSSPPAGERDAPSVAAPIYRAGLGRHVPRGFVRIGPALTIPDVMRGFGIDCAPLCATAGIPLVVFDDPDNTLPMARLGRLVALCEAACQRSDLGLLVADGTSASNLGMVGFLLKQAPDLRTALHDLTRYIHHTDHAATLLLDIRENMATVGYAVIEPNVPARDVIQDGAIAIYRNILRGLCGPKWKPTQVTLSHRCPPRLVHYDRYFEAPVIFDTELTTLSFEARWLDTPIAHADAALRRVLQEQIEILETEEAGCVTEQVRRLLRTALLTSSGSIEDIAGLLRINRRTLARRLEAEGTGFRQLSDEIRFEIARQLLEHTSMTMTQIALALKYSESSAFSRAFRQWAGLAPREWRARHARAASQGRTLAG